MACSRSRPKRSRPKTDPSDNITSTHPSKKSKPTKQTRVTAWGNMIRQEPENQEPQRIRSDSPLSSLDETNNHADLLSNADDENVNDYIPNAGTREVTNVDTRSSTHQDTQPVSILDSQTAIGNTLVVLNLASPPAITDLDFSKYPGYIYSPPLEDPEMDGFGLTDMIFSM